MKFLFPLINPLKFTANVIVIYDLPEVRGLWDRNVFITEEMPRCSSHKGLLMLVLDLEHRPSLW